MDLLVFLEKESNSRVEYVFHHVFSYFLGLNIKLTSDYDYFLNTDVPKITYTSSPVSDFLFFHCVDLLFEKDIVYQLPGGTQEPSAQQTTSSPTASPTQSQSPSAFEGFVLDTVTEMRKKP